MLPAFLRFLHPYLHFFGLVLMVAGLPFSVFLMSFSQFWIVGNWILEGDYRTTLRQFMHNRRALLLSGVMLMLIPGMLYTTDVQEGMKMLRLNLPFLLLPFILSSRPPLPSTWYFLLLRLFLLSVFAATLVCALKGLPAWLRGEMTDIRQISLFISHIRFSLFIAFSILLIMWILLSKPYRFLKGERILLAVAAVWMFAFLLILQSLTGLAILLFIIVAWGFVLVRQRLSGIPALAFTLAPVLLLLASGWYAVKAYRDYFTPATDYILPLPEKTAAGNDYTHDLSLIENGYYVFAFVSEAELRDTWKTRSALPLGGPDGKGNPLYATLIRFLNSKGLHKDAGGLAALSDQEIRYIEQGIANCRYTGLWGIRMRFYQLLWELEQFRQDDYNASGHTMGMKLEFFRNAMEIIARHPLTGVGIGDVPQAFRNQYEQNNSNLEKQWWMTSHNQYLYLTVAAGIPGLIVFLICFLGPGLSDPQLRPYIPFRFLLLIAAVSMLTEDTLTTQAGVSFVAFFYSLFLFSRPGKEPLQSQPDNFFPYNNTEKQI